MKNDDFDLSWTAMCSHKILIMTIPPDLSLQQQRDPAHEAVAVTLNAEAVQRDPAIFESHPVGHRPESENPPADRG